MGIKQEGIEGKRFLFWRGHVTWTDGQCKINQHRVALLTTVMCALGAPRGLAQSHACLVDGLLQMFHRSIRFSGVEEKGVLMVWRNDPGRGNAEHPGNNGDENKHRGPTPLL